MIKLEAIGAAAFMQGYVALDGLGITRTRNHMVEVTPAIIKKSLKKNLFFLILLRFNMFLRIDCIKNVISYNVNIAFTMRLTYTKFTNHYTEIIRQGSLRLFP